MKRSLRLPVSFLLFTAVCTLLTCRLAVGWFGRGGGSGGGGVRLRWAASEPQLRKDVDELLDGTFPASAPSSAQHRRSITLNSTLLRLAAADTSEPQLRKDVDELLDDNFPSLHRRSTPLYRRDNHRPLHPIRRSAHFRVLSPKEYQVFPEVRGHLRDWFRRRRFNPDVLSQLVPLVKTPIDRHRNVPANTRRYPSCAVVGNSGILLKQEHGELIDRHEMVIRLNNARISGYQRYVGKKTGLSFVNSNILLLCARRNGCFCHPYGEEVPMIMYICQAVHLLDYTLCSSSHKAPLLITDPGFDLLMARVVKYYSLKRFVEETGKGPEEWGKKHDESMFHYSSGMQAVVLALGICDEVGIFGFGKSSEAKHHYHTNQKKELDLHDYEAEYAFYRDLVERPEVIPFLTDSEFKVPHVVFYH